MDRTLLLDSYAAKTCPYALHLDRVAPEGERLGFGEAADGRIAAGNAFETLVGERLAVFAEGVVSIPSGRSREEDPNGWAEDRARRLELTLEAIEVGAPVIWNPRLPADPVSHRSGEPDLLVRTEDAFGAVYLPVDVKAHHALSTEFRSHGGTIADLVTASGPKLVSLGPNESAHPEDLLQLAHYWRMLEAIGRVPRGEPRGAIIGWSGKVDGPPIVALFDLLGTMDQYAKAFDAAFAVVERAVAVADGADLPSLGRPWYGASCHECGWRGVCGPELVSVGHVSLVKPNRRIRPEIDAMGIETIDALAELDPSTTRPDGRSVGESSAWREAIARARMARAGDPPPFAFLPEVSGELHPVPRLWRRPTAPNDWGLSRRDVELDVDMESAVGGVYLWGTMLTYRSGHEPLAGFEPGYHGFGSGFDLPGDHTTAAVFVEFLEFVVALQRACGKAGLSFGAYCYAGPSAEEPAMRRCAALVQALTGRDLSDAVEEILSSPDWIDLLDELRARVQSLNGHGLKIVAKATGFAWRAEDAGGEASMRWYERATTDPDPGVRAAHRQKILEYNEDDVAATRHLREWFAANGPERLALVP